MGEGKIQRHYHSIRRILIGILVLNWLVAAAKIIYGLFSHCSSIAADGFHSLSDGASNIIGLIGISFACQPTDRDHPYGHKKYETLFSLGIAALLFVLAFNVAKQGISRLFHPALPNIDIRSFLVMLVTLGVNIAVSIYEYRKGKSLQSDILISDALHTKADILTSIAVIAGLIVIKLGFPVVDPVITVLISFFIAHSGFEIIKESSRVLCDTAAILDVKKIVDIVLGIPGAVTCHKIRTRGRPDDIYVDLHVQVSSTMHVGQAHQVSYAIEEAIKKEIPQVTDVVVHIEPKVTKAPSG